MIASIIQHGVTRRTFTVASAAALASIALGGAGLGDALADGADDVTLLVKGDGDPANFCPDTVADDYFFPVACNVFNRLVKLDIASNVLPDAAQSWEVSDDGLTITFHLRDDLVWSDGEPLTAEDARYTFEYIRNEPSCFFCSYLASVESVEAPDDVTLVFHMSAPDVALVTNLGWYANFIMPKHVYDVEGTAWVDNPAAQLTGADKVVSSGPYRIESYQPGQTIAMVANETSPVQPVIGRIVLSIIADESTAVQALINGEIDVYDGVPATNKAEVESAEGLALAAEQKPVPLRMIFNCNDENMSRPEVRRAIAMCVDRADISAKVGGGVMPADNCMYPPVIAWASNTEDTAPDCDLAAAEQLLIDAGYEKDGDGNYLSGVAIDTFEFAGLPDMARLIVGNMKQIGIDCSVNVLETNAWQDKCMQRKDYTVCMMGGTMGPDPSSLALRYGTGASSNVGDWSNAEFDDLVAQANAEGDQDRRAELYKQAQAIMAEELPMVPVLDWVSLFGYATIYADLPCATEASDGTPLGDNDYTRVRLA